MVASTATGTLSRRRRRRTEESYEPTQLLQPPAESYDGALALLNRISLTKEDISAFIHGVVETPHDVDPHEQAYNDRRREIREHAAQVADGDFEIDEDMRLVPTPSSTPPGILLPPVGPGHPAPPRPADNEEEERRWLEREDHETAEAIARAVQRYRQAGVPEEDFVLIRVAPRQQSTVNFTFRRVCFAVLAVVTAFVCIMLQTLPLVRSVKHTNLAFDIRMRELLQVRDFCKHVRHCDGIHRCESNSSRMQKLWQKITSHDAVINCADGVLHIPAKHLLLDRLHDLSSTQDDYDVLEPYLNGVNVSWFLPCRSPDKAGPISQCFPGSNTLACNAGVSACFRGVHDNLVASEEVDKVLQLGAHLIEAGGDHNEIYHEASLLSKWIPSVVSTLKDLLHSQYSLEGQWDPVAFRISVALPMDAAGVRLYGYMADSLLERNINRTVYIEWLETTKRMNNMAAYSFPPPFATKGERNPCYLMSDLDADPNFAIHTSVFLSDSAGIQYAGGASLYVDDHPSNSNPRNKIQRGVSIDGSRGRIVVSTGGAENPRCRLPVRAGIRAVLQIWWNCTI